MNDVGTDGATATGNESVAGIPTSGTVLVVDAWHGTRRRFSAFDPERSETEYGCFFADSPEGAVLYADDDGGRVVGVRLRFANPFRCTMAEWGMGTAPDPRDVAAAGVHDGYVIDGMDGVSFAAWDPGTIEILGDAFAHGTPEFESLRSIAVERGFLDPIAPAFR